MWVDCAMWRVVVNDENGLKVGLPDTKFHRTNPGKSEPFYGKDVIVRWMLKAPPVPLVPDKKNTQSEHPNIELRRWGGQRNPQCSSMVVDPL